MGYYCEGDPGPRLVEQALEGERPYCRYAMVLPDGSALHRGMRHMGPLPGAALRERFLRTAREGAGYFHERVLDHYAARS